MKRKLFFALAILAMGLQAADVSIQSVEETSAPVKITLKKSPEAQVEAGAVPSEGYDFVEQYATDPISLTSFKETLDTNYIAKLPTIIARVAVEGPNSTRLYTYWTMFSATDYIFGKSYDYEARREISFFEDPTKWSRTDYSKYSPHNTEDLQRRRITGHINYYGAYGDANSVTGFYYLWNDEQLSDASSHPGRRYVFKELYGSNQKLDAYLDLVIQEPTIPSRLERMPHEIKETTDKIAKLKIEMPKEIQEKQALLADVMRRVAQLDDRREELGRQLDVLRRNPTVTPEENRVQDEYNAIWQARWAAGNELIRLEEAVRDWSRKLSEAEQELKNLVEKENGCGMRKRRDKQN